MHGYYVFTYGVRVNMIYTFASYFTINTRTASNKDFDTDSEKVWGDGFKKIGDSVKRQKYSGISFQNWVYSFKFNSIANQNGQNEYKE